jgi:phosphoserine phosphatase
MFYVFDLDGTLANAEHRVHYIKQEPPDWESFLAAKDKDTPILSIVNIFNALLDQGHRIEIWTGRRKDQEEDTRQWLSENGLAVVSVWIPIRMRSNGDRREDFIVKEAYLKYGVPDLIFEDRTQMVKMWRSLGIRVAQVADGDY